MRVVEKEIGVGDSAVDITVGDMCRLALRDSRHPGIKRLAHRLKEGKSTREAIRTAHDYVVKHVPYRKDPKGVEEVTAPIYSLGIVPPSGEGKRHFKRGGDCDDQTTALASILLAMGIQPKIKVIAWRVRDFTHVYLVAVLPNGEEIPCDPVLGRHGFDNEKTTVIRSKEYDCMMQRTLEDGPSSLSGCSCGGKCGGCRRRRNARSGCCPQNHEQSPVNVFVNTGRVSHSDNRRADVEFKEAVSRAAERARNNGTPIEREIIKEKPKIQRQFFLAVKNVHPKLPDINLPPPLIRMRQNVGYPTGPSPERVRWPEFY